MGKAGLAVAFDSLVMQDNRFGQVRKFDRVIMTPIAISESGHIGIYQKEESRLAKRGFWKNEMEVIPEHLIVLHISEVTGVELVVDNKSGLGGAIVGGLIFGGGGAVVGQAISSGKAKSIDLQIKTSDFQFKGFSGGHFQP